MEGLLKINLVVVLAIFIITVEVVCEVGIIGPTEHQNVGKDTSKQNLEASQNVNRPSSGGNVLNKTEDGNLRKKLVQKVEGRHMPGNVNEAQAKANPSHNNTLSNHFEKSNISLLMEGGGKETPDHITFASPDSPSSDSEKPDGDVHASGSKGRKGVPQISSIVPRKGVPEDGGNKSVTLDNKEHLPSNTPNEPTQTFKTPLLVSVHNKKPEYVSDKEDVDDFDKYSIIKTSTTGEDYVIIGIVIVIGIWFSVFGGLIFYRRAGEYWDRRHYRRMDFLVEGMYND